MDAEREELLATLSEDDLSVPQKDADVDTPDYVLAGSMAVEVVLAMVSDDPHIHTPPLDDDVEIEDPATILDVPAPSLGEVLPAPA